MSLFRVPASEPLAQYDAALAVRLFELLLETLRDELGCPEAEALERAGTVAWTVTRERDGMWLNLTSDGSTIGVGGGSRRDEELLAVHVRQMAYDLCGRELVFNP